MFAIFCPIISWIFTHFFIICALGIYISIIYITKISINYHPKKCKKCLGTTEKYFCIIYFPRYSISDISNFWIHIHIPLKCSFIHQHQNWKNIHFDKIVVLKSQNYTRIIEGYFLALKWFLASSAMFLFFEISQKKE